MKQSDSIAKLAAALVKVQAELKAIGKDSTNPHFKNNYASLDVITETVRPILAKNGLSLIQGTSPVTEAEGRLTALTIESMLLHESGEWLSSGVTMPVGTVATKNKEGNVIAAEPTAQTAGGAITYGRRYGLAALLALTTDEDDDGVRASTRAEAPNGGRTAPPVGNVSSLEPKPEKVKAVDVRIPVAGKLTRLGDLSEAELVKMLPAAQAAPKFAALAKAIEEVLEELRNDLPF